MTSPIIDGGNAFTVYGTTSPANLGPVVAPDITTYAARTPYLTAVEFTEAGTGVDVSQLVPAGSGGDESAALLRVIRQASAWADSLTYKVLAATSDIQAGRYMVRDGIASVPLKYAPVTAVTAVSFGANPWTAAPLTDLSRAGILPPALLQVALPGCWSGRTYMQVTYVNGWTNTALTAAASAGAGTLTLASNLGVYPGQTLTVDDGSTTEQVTVGAGYVVGASGPVPLAYPTVNAHAIGAAATALPPDIKRAVIALTSCLIKTRGSEAFVMQSLTSPPAKTELSESGGIEDFEIATGLLARYRRVW